MSQQHYADCKSAYRNYETFSLYRLPLSLPALCYLQTSTLAVSFLECRYTNADKTSHTDKEGNCHQPQPKQSNTSSHGDQSDVMVGTKKQTHSYHTKKTVMWSVAQFTQHQMMHGLISN